MLTGLIYLNRTLKYKFTPSFNSELIYNVPGHTLTSPFKQYLLALEDKSTLPCLQKIGRGIEREALRILPEGKLSETPHYKELGSALTHPLITTDYAETLLEFITPVSHEPETSIAQLQDIQKFTLTKINNELLWPMSMPCFVSDEDKIQLAQYGDSNIGKMKTVYRQGLKNRYGSMMQVISGIHFNFSFPKGFWQSLQKVDQNTAPIDDYISEKYFSLLRNYKRYCWLIPYLYGCSPAICASFLQDKAHGLPFKKSASGYLYLEYATSLRMSDLGYTNSAQSDLHICYNDLDGYVKGVEEAMNLASIDFAKIGVFKNGTYQQLNSNVLQIENELYAPIRPKRVAQSGEKPSEALKERGVEYIEVRALDVNPFSDTGISVEQIYFLDIFLTYCALSDSPLLACEQQNEYEKNMNDVVIQGRDPKLKLSDQGAGKSIKAWGEELFLAMTPIAELLDKAHGSSKYREALSNELAKINNPALTPSARLLDMFVNKNERLTDYALSQAKKYQASLLSQDYQFFDEKHFDKTVRDSLRAQNDIEASDDVDFETFLSSYFTR